MPDVLDNFDLLQILFLYVRRLAVSKLGGRGWLSQRVLLLLLLNMVPRRRVLLRRLVDVNWWA